MSLARMKASVMRVATEYGNVDFGDFSGTKMGKYGRVTPSMRKRWKRIEAACAELVAEGKLEYVGGTGADAGWKLKRKSRCVECDELKNDPEDFYDGLRCRTCCEASEPHVVSEETARECSVCDGMLIELGTLGNRTHYRCRNCGMDSSFLDSP